MSDKIVVDHVGDVTYPLRKMLLQKNWQLLLACISIAIAAILVPIVLYTVVQAQSEWYYYTGYLFGNVATAILMNDILYRLQGKKWLVSCLTAGYTCACLIVFAHIIHIIYVSGISGDPSNSYKPSDQWQCDNVFDAKTIMDWRCMDGGWKDF